MDIEKRECVCGGIGWVCSSHPEAALGTCDCGARGTPCECNEIAAPPRHCIVCGED